MRKPSSSSSSGPTPGKKTPCCTKVGLKRGPWTPEEDELLSGYINREGEGRWRTLPKRAGLLRCGKSCRLRWMNYLRPCVKRGHIAPDEEDLILRLHRLLGNRWSLIAGRIPGRTDNEIKNYWNTHLSKKLISQGIDPRTHRPLEAAESSKAASSVKPVTSPSNDPVSSEINAADPRRQNGTLATGMGVIRSGNEDDEDDINYCTDDLFSSFLNSLINEEDCYQHPANNILPCADSSNFGAAGWESAVISTALINQKEPVVVPSDDADDVLGHS